MGGSYSLNSQDFQCERCSAGQFWYVEKTCWISCLRLLIQKKKMQVVDKKLLCSLISDVFHWLLYF